MNTKRLGMKDYYLVVEIFMGDVVNLKKVDKMLEYYF